MILVKFSKNMDFGEIFEKIWILVKIFENFENVDLMKNFRKFSILGKFSKKFGFWAKF